MKDWKGRKGTLRYHRRDNNSRKQLVSLWLGEQRAEVGALGIWAFGGGWARDLWEGSAAPSGWSFRSLEEVPPSAHLPRNWDSDFWEGDAIQWCWYFSAGVMRLGLGVWKESRNWNQLLQVKGTSLFSLLLPLVLPLVHSTLRTQWELVGKGETVVCRVPAPASRSGVRKGEYRAETLA